MVASASVAGQPVATALAYEPVDCSTRKVRCSLPPQTGFRPELHFDQPHEPAPPSAIHSSGSAARIDSWSPPVRWLAARARFRELLRCWLSRLVARYRPATELAVAILRCHSRWMRSAAQRRSGYQLCLELPREEKCLVPSAESTRRLVREHYHRAFAWRAPGRSVVATAPSGLSCIPCEPTRARCSCLRYAILFAPGRASWRWRLAQTVVALDRQQ